MKTKKLILYVVAAGSLLFIRCSGDEQSIVNTADENNLIKNSSFEFNNNPSLEYWDDTLTDSSYIGFSKDAPVDGGNYSVRLKNEWTFPGTIAYYIIPPTGTHSYHLSAFGKVVPSTPGSIAGGIMALFHVSSGNSNLEGFVRFTDTTWTNSSLIDTLTTTVSDTLIIRLQGNIDQWSNGNILFDLCTFVKLD